jgi:hypothetical protein
MGNPGAVTLCYTPPACDITIDNISTTPESCPGAMLAGGWNPEVVAFLEEEPAVELFEGGGPAGTVQILGHESDRFLLRADALRPAILVLAENHYPDWRVRVDGEEAPLLRVNHSLMGVAIERGEHGVEFAFRPAALYRGLWISGLALLLIVAAASWPLLAGLRARRRGATASGGAAAPA